MTKIKKVIARQILDSRGNPTVEADVLLADDTLGRAAVPSGASTGEHEAIELRDNAKSYGGKSVLKACDNVDKKIAPALKNKDVTDQEGLDQIILDLDGTPNKKKLGANAILAVSLAAARAAAQTETKPLYEYLAEKFDFDTKKYTLPVPMMNLINGGQHAENSTDIQEYMVVPYGAENIAEAVRMGSEIFHELKKIIRHHQWPTTVGDEGGFAPPLPSNKMALDILVEAIEKAGYKPGKNVGLAMDVAASEFFQNGIYDMVREGKALSTKEIITEYQGWIDQYPIVSIEDGLQENDWDNWPKLEAAIGADVMNVGDDFLVTNVERLQRAIDSKSANAILIKLNQIGTLTETVNAIKLAHQNDWRAVVSHRSGETCDSFIADLVVACGTGYIKTGSLSRSERVEKYNRLMRIEEELGSKCRYGLK